MPRGGTPKRGGARPRGKTARTPVEDWTSKIEYKNISLLSLNTVVEQMGKSPRVSDALSIGRGALKEIREWVRSYDERNSNKLRAWMAFVEDWKVLRLGVSLQVRLYVEQVLWDAGGKYRELVTGFRAIDNRVKTRK